MIAISRIIEFRNIDFSKGKRNILSNLSFSLKKNVHNVIVGKNGIGKSTVLRLITGMEIPDKGEILIEGTPFVYEEEGLYNIRRKIGVVFHNLEEQLIGETVLDSLIFGMENNCIPKGEMEENIKKYTGFLSIENILESKNKEISEEEKYRVALGAVAVSGAEIILMDEVTSMYDEIMKREISRFINLLLEEGKTVVSITHDINEMAASDYIVYLRGEKSVIEGLSEKVIPQYIADTEEEKDGQKPVKIINLKDMGKELSEEVKIQLSNINITSQKSGKILINNLSASIPDGRITFITGKGSNRKSYLLELISGILSPNEKFSGEIKYRLRKEEFFIKDDSPKRKWSQAVENIKMVFQNPEEQFFERTVRNEIEYNLIKKYIKEEKKENLKQKLDKEIGELALFFGFSEEFLEKSPFVLSTGEKRLLSIAMAVCVKPEIILLDEPFAGLDRKMTRKIMTLLKKLKRDGITVIIAMQHSKMAIQYSDYHIPLEEISLKDEYSEDKRTEEKNVKKSRIKKNKRFLYKLDSRSKIIGTFIMVIILLATPFFMSDEYFTGYLYISVFLFAISMVSGLKSGNILKKMKIYFFTGIILMFFNILLMKNGRLLLNFGFIKIYDKPVLYSLSIIWQIFLLLWVTEILTETTKDSEMIKGINFLLGKRDINSEIGLMFTAFIGFLPIIHEKTRQLVKIQKSRGADFSITSIKNIEKIFLLIIPLIHLTFQKMNKTAEIMLARNYITGRRRTEYAPLKLSMYDFIYGFLILSFSIFYIFHFWM